VCIAYNLRNSEKLGGPGKVVEIDESKFGKRKYNVGRIFQGQWVFGGIERGSKKLFMVAVPSRDTETLLAIIKEWIEPGTTIISDCWKAYNCLSSEGYRHLTVNHSLNFVDADTGAHTQNIESNWRAAKAAVPKFGNRRHFFPGYLARYLFIRRFPNNGQRFHEFLLAAGQLYNPGI